MQTGSSVADIFAAEGEAAFRGREAAALTDASMHDPAVVACGGGVVLEPANRITLRNTGVAVFLDVPLEDLRVPRASRRGQAADPGGGRPGAPAGGLGSRSTASSRRTWSTGRGSPAEVADAIVEELRWSA